MPDPHRPDHFSLEQSEDRLTWIFGSSRSGSTWLLRMLAGLDGVVPIDDPHLGHHLGVWRPISLAWAAAEHPPDLTTLDRLKHDKASYFFSDRYRDAWEPALRRLIAARFDAEVHDHLTGGSSLAVRSASGAGVAGVASPGARPGPGSGGGDAGHAGPGVDGQPLVVVKEPGSHVADHLVSLFPRSRLVFLLRDGRDVVDSWLSAYRSGSWALDEGAFPATEEGRVALVRWQSAVWAFRTDVVQRVFAAHPDDRKVRVRYEDLVADPVPELARIAAAVPLGATPEALAAVAAAHDYGRVDPAQKGDGKHIRSARPGGWRTSMTPTEQRVMHEIMRPMLVRLGYVDPDPLPLALT
ncbi:MAG TPA: sulfotransferase [Acidimicrobiales bacterium]|nr:sulfotransferase [Acidimicrobiales bacterium]